MENKTGQNVGLSEGVAIVNSVMDHGSTGSLARQLYEYGKIKGYNTYVFYGRGEEYEDENIIRIDSKFEVYIHKASSLITGMQGSFSNSATRKMLDEFDKHNIRKAIFLNLHGYYLNEGKLFEYCRNRGVQIVYIMPDEYAGLGKCAYCLGCDKFKLECRDCPQIHAYPKSLFFDTSNKIFKKKMEAYENQKITFVGPKSNIDHLEGAMLLKDKDIIEADWGIDLSLYRHEINEELYDKYKIPRDRVLVLTVASFKNKRKGVEEYFFGVAKAMVTKEIQDFHFINVGYDGNLTEEEMPKNMTVIPYIEEQHELTQLYSMCDLYILASVTDTQPISVIISLACETPVCCFYTSGLKYLDDRDSLAIKYCDQISVEALEAIIETTKKKDSFKMKACRKLAEERYSVELFNKKVYGVIGL